MPSDPAPASPPSTQLALHDKLQAEWPKLKERLGASLRELDSYHLSLPTNPSNQSLAFLFDNLAKAREYTNRIGSIYLEALKLLSRLNRLKNQSDRRVDTLVGNAIKDQPDTFKNCRGADEKRLVALTLVSPDEQRLNELLSDMVDTVKNFFSAVQFAHGEMTQYKECVLTQLGIIKSMIIMGDLAIDVNAVRAVRTIMDEERPGKYRAAHRPTPPGAPPTTEETPREEGPCTL